MVHNRPHFRSLRNKHLYLAYANVSDYPTPWTMWRGTLYPPGSFVGNIKIGPPSAKCPEQNKERYFASYFVNLFVIANMFLGQNVFGMITKVMFCLYTEFHN